MKDEYMRYIVKNLKENVKNPLYGWQDNQSSYSNLSQIAFNFFAILPMSSKYEQAFNKASYTILARQNNPGQEIIEVGEVLDS